jgi:hypothetical protein
LAHSIVESLKFRLAMNCRRRQRFQALIILFLYDVSAMPITGGPYLTGAFFCDKLLTERDGVMSAIRIVDKWQVNGPTEVMPTTILQTNLAIFLKSGIYRGNGQLSITPITPSNARLQTIVVPLLFEGEDDKGCGLVLPLGFPAQESGLYWFEIVLGGQALETRVITAVPMRVAYLRMVNPTPPQPNQSNR